MPRIGTAQERKGGARRLRQVRDLLGLSQREMTQEFKVAHGAIASWESGTRNLPGPVSKLLELYEEELGLSEQETDEAGLRVSAAARGFAFSRIAGNVLVSALVTALTRWLSGDERTRAVRARAQAALVRNVADSLAELEGVALKAAQTLGYLDFLLSDGARDQHHAPQCVGRRRNVASNFPVS